MTDSNGLNSARNKVSHKRFNTSTGNGYYHKKMTKAISYTPSVTFHKEGVHTVPKDYG